MPSTGEEDDPSFVVLPARLRHRIDGAFDSVVSSGTALQQSTAEGSTEAGGFIIGSQSTEYEAGGFISPLKSYDAQSYIPLSEIPRALNILGLFPDDDTMEVFRSAATGWGAQNGRNSGVNRKDWRAVCAALLEGEHGGDSANQAVDEDIEMGVNSGPDSDEYRVVEELSSDPEEPSSDEYERPGQTIGKAKKRQKVVPRMPSRYLGTEVSRQLTESQKAECRQDFSRFFPHVPDGELDHQRIMIKDITRVADLLKENLKVEEILEMMEAFSTSPDKSVDLADFEHMMVLTKLI